MTDRKLYTLTAKKFRSFSHIGLSGETITTECEDVPMIKWPDGRWCLDANIYMQGLVERGLSRRDRGGTLHTYATQLSPLIRFCYNSGTDFHELNDAQFTSFVKSLTEHRSNGILLRTNATAIRIARLTLDFLSEVGRNHRLDNFVGPSGRIRATRIASSISASGGRREIRNSYWNHRSIPLGQAPRIRLPISQENLAKLRSSVLEISASPFLRKRRYVLLALLETTGARRYEISRLRVEDIVAATQMPSPMLRIQTAKRGGNQIVHREIPITHVDLALVMEYIEKNRSRIIRKTCGKANDSGTLFISETTGLELNANTITQEIYALRCHAKIEEQACAHMFRHAFITNRYKWLAERHKLENPDDFRRSLLDNEAILKELQQWTGQKSLRSIDIYINYAFESKSIMANAVNTISAISTLQAITSRMEQAERELSKISPRDTLRQVQKILRSGLNDLKNI